MALGIRVTIDSKSKVAMERLNEPAAEQAINLSIRDFGLTLRRTLAVKSPAVTGNFRRRWNVTTIQGKKTVGLEITNAAAYARFVEFPTKPHIIEPKSPGGVLVWRTGGRSSVSAAAAARVLSSGRPGALHPSNFIFSKKVQHPGTKGQFVFKRSFQETAPKFFEFLRGRINAAFKS